MSALHAVSKIRLAVGSLNPVKNNAALLGSQKALKQEIETFGFDVPSGVSDQPMSDSETLIGAIARAKNAYHAFKAAHGTPPDFAVGLEGGVGPSIVCQEDLECFAWIVVYDGHKLGRARTGSFLLPPAIRTLVRGGMELGKADDHLFKTINSKHAGGSVGQMTQGALDRTGYYEHAVILAFVPFLWKDLYVDLSPGL